VPLEPAPADIDTAPLDEPINETFRVGTMAIVWDGDDESIVVEARAMNEDGEAAEEMADADEDDDGSDVVRVQLESRKAVAFARRALDVVAAGRPPCPFCGQPLNPEATSALAATVSCTDLDDRIPAA